MTKEDKAKSRSIFILEKVLESIIFEAAVTFPATDDPIDVAQWAETLKLLIIEATKRQHVSNQPAYKDLSIEEKAEKILELTQQKVELILRRRVQQAEADNYLSLKTKGPPPLPPPSPDEEPSDSSAPHEIQEDSSEPQ